MVAVSDVHPFTAILADAPLPDTKSEPAKKASPKDDGFEAFARSPSFNKTKLTFIQEVDHTSHHEDGHVLFLDVVLMGSHAHAAAMGACFDEQAKSEAGVDYCRSPEAYRRPQSRNSRGSQEGRFDRRGSGESLGDLLEEFAVRPTPSGIPSPSGPDGLAIKAPPTVTSVEDDTSSDDASDVPSSLSAVSRTGSRLSSGSLPDLNSMLISVHHAKSVVGPLPSIQQAQPLQQTGSRRTSLVAPDGTATGRRISTGSLSRRESNASVMSTLSNLSRTSITSFQSPDLCCYCNMDGYHIRMNFHPMERLNDRLPTFPGSQAASTGYVVLLPMDCPDLDDVCSSLRQRLDEVRFQARRAAQARHGDDTTASAADDPRLGRVALFNTTIGHLNTLDGPGDSLPKPVAESREYPFIESSTHDMGTCDLCDSGTLFETLVLKTAKWLLSQGAVQVASDERARNKGKERKNGWTSAARNFAIDAGA